MLVSEKRAKHLARLSYKVSEYSGDTSKLITLKKALEFDVKTAEDIIKKYEREFNIIEMKEKISSYGGKTIYLGKELIRINNPQYVESYEFEKDNFNTLRVYLEDKSIINISSLDKVYAPNIYGELFPSDNENRPILPSKKWWELFFQLMIIEDRKIVPYMMEEKLYHITSTTLVFPMEESLAWIEYHKRDIEIVNRLLAKCNGYIIADKSSHESYVGIGIKPTILYLEDIGELDLANDLRKFAGDEIFLNTVIDKAEKGIYGIILDRDDIFVKLL